MNEEGGGDYFDSRRHTYSTEREGTNRGGGGNYWIHFLLTFFICSLDSQRIRIFDDRVRKSQRTISDRVSFNQE